MCNKIIGLNLYMEALNLAVAAGAGMNALFGMNLLTGIEEHPFAFYIIAVVVAIATCLIFFVCIFKFKKVKISGKFSEYPLLKDILR